MADETSSLSYRDAGVDIDAAEEAIERAKGAIRSTFGPRVLADVGAFGGLFDASNLGEEPVLVATADGVGTKVRIAAETGRFSTVGACLVNHCINDALVQGARPLFFLDYIGTGKLDPESVSQAIEGVAVACKKEGVALLGGETAEMPGVYPPGEFDLVGTLVGVVEKKHILDGSRVKAGDRLIGLPSEGLHTNGYSLARRIVTERMGIGWSDPFPGADEDAASVLLKNHRCYLGVLQPILEDPSLHAMAHITGGGVAGNLPRSLGGKGARVDRSVVPPQNVFEQLRAAGGVELNEAWRAFNMGVGLILAVDAEDAERIAESLQAAGEPVFLMGEVVESTGVEWIS